MRRSLVVLVLVLAGGTAQGDELPDTPFTQDPLGPLLDVTNDWARYQPRAAFCVKPDAVFQFPGPEGPPLTGADPDCAASDYGPSDQGLIKIRTDGLSGDCGTCTPDVLCAGCRRLFLDYSKIPATNEPPRLYAHGHAYFHFSSFNPSYTIEPVAHSPNIKNFTHEKLFVPDSSPHQPFVYGFDTHNRAYTGNTVHIIHNTDQGPFYTGPWYVNRDGDRITGAYVDIMVDPDYAAPPQAHRLNEIGYGAGFHSGEEICFDEILGRRFGDQYRDGDGFYGGCIDGFGSGRATINPFA